MADRQPLNRPVIIALCIALAVAGWQTSEGNWDMVLPVVLMAFSIFSDLTAVRVESALDISGSFLALVVAMVFLGGTPAALIGVVTILVGWLRWGTEWQRLLDNVLVYTVFPLAGGIAFHHMLATTGLATSEPSFYLSVFGLFVFALAINFSMVAGYAC